VICETGYGESVTWKGKMLKIVEVEGLVVIIWRAEMGIVKLDFRSHLSRYPKLNSSSYIKSSDDFQVDR
jgi:hypothetical protein